MSRLILLTIVFLCVARRVEETGERKEETGTGGSQGKPGPPGYKTFFMLNSTEHEHEISTSHIQPAQLQRPARMFKFHM